MEAGTPFHHAIGAWQQKEKDMTTILTPEAVNKLAVECLYKDGEPVLPDAIMVEGIVRNFKFHPERIKQNSGKIAELLDCLPPPFHARTGGGWSFLEACNDKEGNQWTGDHSIMEVLFCLGTAAGKIICPMPREMWGVLPGGVPYYTIRTIPKLPVAGKPQEK